MFNKERNTYTEQSVPEQRKERREALLTRVECDALRGLAIIGIFLHNYCHWLRPVVKENEYQYYQRNVDKLYQVLQGAWNELFFFHILSFFGHYGVPVFLFLSAYGLTMKYEKQQPTVPTSMLQSQSSLPVFGFIKYHWVKLFRMMIVGFVAFTMVDAITDAPHDYHVDGLLSVKWDFLIIFSQSRRYHLAWSLLVLWAYDTVVYRVSTFPLSPTLGMECYVDSALLCHTVIL